jgi:lactate dehydrogenase-like 2-hydroxyacid dehydrogenase
MRTGKDKPTGGKPLSRLDATVLIPGWMHEHARHVLGTQFNLVETPDCDIHARLSHEIRASIRGVACRNRIDSHFIDSLPNLEIIASYGVGYDAVDAAYARSKNVIVTNTPDVLNEEVADLTIGLLVSVVREIPKAHAFVREGHWQTSEYPLSRLTLRNRRVGIYGMGRIGRCIARRIEAFGLPVAYHSRRPADGVAYDYFPSLLELAHAVDVLIAIVPGDASTVKTVNAEVLSALGPEGVFINVGRGTVVDEDALIGALRTGTIAAAGLDVIADEPNVSDDMRALGNLTILPHIGSASVATRTAMADVLARNLISWFQGGAAISPVP